MSIQINSKSWTEADELLGEIGKVRLQNYTVVLCNEKKPFGTGVLIKRKQKAYILTAAHVANKIGTIYKKIGLAIILDDRPRELPLREASQFLPLLWDDKFKDEDLETNPYQCKDLALVTIPEDLIGHIDATKEFVRLEVDHPLASDSCYCGYGFICPKELSSIYAFGFCLDEQINTEEVDYYIAHAKSETFGTKYMGESSIDDFQGYSGGGLFLVQGEKITLAGIAFYQNKEPLKNGYVEVAFIGPKAIANCLNFVLKD